MEENLQQAVAAIGQTGQLCKSTRAGTVGDFLTGFQVTFLADFFLFWGLIRATWSMGKSADMSAWKRAEQ